MGSFSDAFLKEDKLPTTPIIGETIIGNSFGEAFGVEKRTIQRPTQIISPPEPEKRGFLDRLREIGASFKAGWPTFGEEVKKEGLGGAIADILIPKDKRQSEEVIKQNLRTYVESLKGEEILTEVVLELGKEKAKQFTATGTAYAGLINPTSLTEWELDLLRKRGYLDEADNLKVGKVAIETAKNIMDLSIFFPQLFAASTLITGGKTINVLGRALPIARLVDGATIAGTYNTLYTPNLENILKDKEIFGKAVKNFTKGATIGTLITIPLSFIFAGPAIKKLSAIEQEEVHRLYISLISSRFLC